MEWFGRNLDDALFPSMLLPVVEKAFETLFPAPGETESHVTAVMVFHRELGVVLHSKTSRRVLPKVSFGTGWIEVAKSIRDAVPPAHRMDVESLLNSENSFFGSYPLLPDRIEEWDGLFFWSLPFDGGQALVLRASSKKDATTLQQDFSPRADKVEQSLKPMLSRWLLDATCEVFWSRILSNAGADLQPVPGRLSPEWVRTVPMSESASPRVFCGEYLNTPGQGWKRSVKLLPPEGAPRWRGRSEVGDKGKSLDVPVDLWGLHPLGTIHLPADLLRSVDTRELLSRLRESRRVALRSLYRHLILPGPLSFLLCWNPESNSFDLSLLKDLPSFAGEKALGHAVMTVRLASRALLAKIEKALRPADMIFSEGAEASFRTFFLAGCDPELARESVVPRLLAIGGIEEKDIVRILSLADYLKEAPTRK